MIKLLSVILFIFLFMINKKRGFKTFLTFYLNIFLIILYLIFIYFGFNAIILAIITTILCTVVSLFLLNGNNLKTKSSFISILIVLFFIFILIFIIGKKANIQGFGIESLESIGLYSYDINYDMTDVMIGMYLLCIIGTVIDTSISISSSMNEVLENNKGISEKDIFKSGMNVGKDILSTTINTLYFPFISSFIGFFLWHNNQSFSYLINYKVFAQFMVQLLISFIASILIIPITAFVSSRLLLNKELLNLKTNEKKC